MRCIVCYSKIPDDQSECSKCGDHVGKWRQMDAQAQQYLGQGVAFAADSDLPRAMFAFFKAVILQPADANALGALGKTLALQGYYEEAIFYLTKAVELSGDATVREHFGEALTKAQELAALALDSRD